MILHVNENNCFFHQFQMDEEVIQCLLEARGKVLPVYPHDAMYCFTYFYCLLNIVETLFYKSMCIFPLAFQKWQKQLDQKKRGSRFKISQCLTMSHQSLVARGYPGLPQRGYLAAFLSLNFQLGHILTFVSLSHILSLSPTIPETNLSLSPGIDVLNLHIQYTHPKNGWDNSTHINSPHHIQNRTFPIIIGLSYNRSTVENNLICN